MGTDSARMKASKIEWCNWDDAILEKLVSDSKTTLGPLDDQLSSVERTSSVARKVEFGKELVQLSKWLEKSTIARCAPYAAGNVEYNVARAFDQLQLVIPG